MSKPNPSAFVLMAGLALASLAVAPALAEKAKEPQPRPAAFAKLIACRAITDSVARLACYDTQTEALDEAERNSDVMVVDRQQIKKARRSLFGLELPSIGGMFGKDNDKAVAEEELTSIDSTLKSASTGPNGKMVITIEDGARWIQIDTGSIRTPKVGQPVRIKRAALGSYFVSVNGQPSLRMRRLN